jgi:hypothetical protein
MPLAVIVHGVAWATDAIETYTSTANNSRVFSIVMWSLPPIFGSVPLNMQ